MRAMKMQPKRTTCYRPGRDVRKWFRAGVTVGLALLLAGSPIAVLAAAPAPPSSLTAVLGGTVSVSLHWNDNSNNETKFFIESATNAGFTESYISFEVGANVTGYLDESVFPDATFYYRVYAVNADGQSSPSNTASVRVPLAGPTVPLPPDNLEAIALSASRIDLGWRDNSSNEQGFRIERATNSAFSQGLISRQVGANVTLYSDTETEPGATYYYRVKSYNSSGMSQPSNLAIITTPLTVMPPAAPTGLNASLATEGGIPVVNLAWTDRSDNENGFIIERAEDVTFSVNDIEFEVDTNTSIFTDDTVFTETTYYYRVYAFNADGSSAYSTAVNITVPVPSSIPAAPGNLTASVTSNGRVHLTWTDSSDNELGFKMKRAEDIAFTQDLKIFTIGANFTSYTDNTAVRGVTYFYLVAAINLGGESESSNIVEVAVPAAPPSRPTNLIATVVGQSRVNLTWLDNSTDESGFRIERAGNYSFTQGLQTFEVAANITSYPDNSVQAGQVYYYRVFSYNNNGASQPSNVATALVQEPSPAPPSNLRVSLAGQNQVRLQWDDNSNNESGFIIERATSSAFLLVEEAFTVSAGVTTYLDNSVSPGMTYYYHVRAIHETAGDSAPSNTANIAILAVTTATTPTANTTPGTVTTTKPVTTSPAATITGPTTTIQTSATTMSPITGTPNVPANTLPGVPAPSVTITNSVPATATTSTIAPAMTTASTTTPNSQTAHPSQPGNTTNDDTWQLSLHAGMRYVNLTWTDPCDNEQAFNVERSTDRINWIRIGSARRNGTTFSDRGTQEQTNFFSRIWAFLFGGLQRGNTYYYRVVAWNSEGTISVSPVVWISTR